MLPPTMHDARRLLHGSRFDVYEVDTTSASGQPLQKQVIVHPGAVVVLGLLPEDRLVLIRNKRIATGQTLLELPAGTLEPPEPPEICAGREMIEETGYRAGRVRALTNFFTSPGICPEKMYAFVAEDLTPGPQALEAGEDIAVERATWSDALSWVRDGTIRDGKTIATLLYYHTFVSGRK